MYKNINIYNLTNQVPIYYYYDSISIFFLSIYIYNISFEWMDFIVKLLPLSSPLLPSSQIYLRFFLSNISSVIYILFTLYILCDIIYLFFLFFFRSFLDQSIKISVKIIYILYIYNILFIYFDENFKSFESFERRHFFYIWN